MRVGVAGLGRMGAVLADRLVAAGHETSVWSRTPRQVRGASTVGSPAELAAACDVVVVLVSDDAAVRRVWLADDGLLAGTDGGPTGAAGGLLGVESSTVRVDTVREVARAAASRGVAAVDVPVSGTVRPALAGELLGLAGGAARDVQRAGPVLDVWCRRVVHLGPLGAGMATKLALNMGMAAMWAALGESYAVAAAHGVDRSAFTDVLVDSPLAGPGVLGKADLLRSPTVPTGEPPSFDVAGVRKDLVAMVATAVGAGVPAAVAAAALASFSAAVAAGHGEADLVAVADAVQAATYRPD